MTHSSPISEFFARAFTPDSYPRVPYVPGQASLCMFGPIDGDGMIHWRPVRRAPHRCKSVLEQHANLPGTTWAREVVSGYWSSTLACTFGYESLTLDCGAWNEEAYYCKQDRLRERFQHQATQKLPLSVPLGISANGSGYRYAVRLELGDVWLEDAHGQGVERLSQTYQEFFTAIQYQAASEDLLHKVFE